MESQGWKWFGIIGKGDYSVVVVWEFEATTTWGELSMNEASKEKLILVPEAKHSFT